MRNEMRKSDSIAAVRRSRTRPGDALAGAHAAVAGRRYGMGQLVVARDERRLRRTRASRELLPWRLRFPAMPVPGSPPEALAAINARYQQKFEALWSRALGADGAARLPCGRMAIDAFAAKAWREQPYFALHQGCLSALTPTTCASLTDLAQADPDAKKRLGVRRQPVPQRDCAFEFSGDQSRRLAARAFFARRIDRPGRVEPDRRRAARPDRDDRRGGIRGRAQSGGDAGQRRLSRTS